ncbi:MAG: glucosaminidase domain-containing protein [Myxococcales bacterium]|nr:glucosaminidase domain-containing protein [Myxococcales bacterium]
MPEVPAKRTTWPSRAAFARDVHAAAVMGGLDPLPAAILTAQSAHETGWGGKVYNFNMAGLKAREGWRKSRPYTVLGGSECIDCKPGEEPSPECPPGQRLKGERMFWRAYDSLREGVDGVLALLQADRYAKARACLRAGDPWYFVQVGEDGWFSAGQDVYLWACSHHLAMVCATVGVDPPLAARLTTPDGRAELLAELRYGSVREMQQQLLGFTGRDADGDYGKATHFALLKLLRGPGAG